MRKEELRTPCYIVQKEKLEANLRVLKQLREETGCRILLAQKAFSMYSLYPLIGEYLDGTTASGLYEARLGAEEMGKENHIFSPAYREEEFDEILSLCGHIVLNSPAQIRKYKDRVKKAGKSPGIRVNPQCSTQEGHAIYDPCAPGSRLGTVKEQLTEELMDGIEGIHFHTLCEQNSDDLEVTLRAVEEQFGAWLPKMKWINFGGGHHITRSDYDIKRLKRCICHMQETYGLEVYLEPGEAVALNAGTLLTEVLETMENGIRIAILDTSAACHMPDVLEMPYRPPVRGSGQPGEKAYTCRLAGPTCLAGDVIGDYSFDVPLRPGDQVIFEDMALYTMVKTNTFNGMPLPSIVRRDKNGNCQVVKEFGYQDFKGRLS